MKWIVRESKGKTANKPLYCTSFDEVAIYMPTWNCTKIKRVRRIVNTAWVVIKFWSLRRWNWKTQLMMMEVDEVETIFTHTHISQLLVLAFKVCNQPSTIPVDGVYMFSVKHAPMKRKQLYHGLMSTWAHPMRSFETWNYGTGLYSSYVD